MAPPKLPLKLSEILLDEAKLAGKVKLPHPAKVTTEVPVQGASKPALANPAKPPLSTSASVR